MRRRYFVIPPLTLVAALAAVELSARVLDTDQLQHEAIAVAAGKGLGETWHQGSTDAWLETVEALGVDYLPDEFVLEEDGYHSRWGFCDFDFDGPTILAMGDSTTRQSMVDRAEQHSIDLPRYTWPALLQNHLGAGHQVCVAAENGFHPRDLSKLLEALQPRLQPDLVLALLCENDLAELSPRVRVDRGDAYVFYRAVAERPVLPSLYWYPLYVRSEAFRFLHWRLASAMPDKAGEIRMALSDAFGVDEALRRMDAQPSQLKVFYLPTLDDAQPLQPMRLGQIAQRAGVDIRTVRFEGSRADYRRSEEDTVHLNLAGHQRVVHNVLPVVRAALGGDEPSPGSQP